MTRNNSVWRAAKTEFIGLPCRYCGNLFEGSMQIDHVVPLSRGGAHEMENMVPCCPRCNASKGSKLLSEWNGGKVATGRTAERDVWAGSGQRESDQSVTALERERDLWKETARRSQEELDRLKNDPWIKTALRLRQPLACDGLMRSSNEQA